MFKKVLLKLSGEALAGGADSGIDPHTLTRLAGEIAMMVNSGIQVGIVIGGGNLFRGRTLQELGVARVTADHMGMLSTVINSLALRDALERAGLLCQIMSAIPVPEIVSDYNWRSAKQALVDGYIVIFAGGTGTTLVTTDSAASLRAIEIGADVLLKATNVDGIYDRDPRTQPDAKRYRKLSFKEALQRELAVMDLAAFSQCRDHAMKVIVFNINKSGALQKVINGEDEGTIVE